MGERITDVIFDLDGTLIDSAPAILSTFRAVLDHHRITPAQPIGEHLIGPPLPATLRLLTGIDNERQIEALADDFKNRYDREGLYATLAYPNVDEMLKRLRARGCTMHIATNKRQHPTRLLIDHFGWADYFDSVYCTDGRTPPFASKDQMLAALLAERSVAPDQAVFVGDTQSDANAAMAHRMIFLAAQWGYGDWCQTSRHDSWQPVTDALAIVDAVENTTESSS